LPRASQSTRPQQGAAGGALVGGAEDYSAARRDQAIALGDEAVAGAGYGLIQADELAAFGSRAGAEEPGAGQVPAGGQAAFDGLEAAVVGKSRQSKRGRPRRASASTAATNIWVLGM
jgi:hypothetical protein